MTEPATVSRIGGRRPTTGTATFTAQIIGLVTPATKARIKALCKRYGLSQSVIVRRCVTEGGLDGLEAALRAERRAGQI